MAELVKAGANKVRGLVKALAVGGVGLGGGVVATYATAVVDKVAKPSKPVANFALSSEGLTVTLQNHAVGESGWWDFGDGSPLEPFDPNKPATHTYPKPGSYSIKLTVRSFLGDEAERSVPADLSAAAPQQLPPSITMTAEPVGSAAVAPATYRIKGQVANTEKVIWDLGDGKVDVTTDTGPFERLVVLDKPGTFPIQVFGHAGKTAVKQAQMVSVAAPTAGSLAVVLRVIDGGMKGTAVEAKPWVRIPVPDKGVGPARFEVTHQLPPGMTADAVQLGTMNKPMLKNVTAAVAPDRKAVVVSGEWAMSGDALLKATEGGRSVMVPLVVAEQKATAVDKMPTEMAKPLTGFNGQMAATLDVPPMPTDVADARRRMVLEIRQASADVRGKSLIRVPDVQFPWTGTLPASEGLPGGGTVTAQVVGGQLKVAVNAPGGVVAVTPADQPAFEFVPVSATAPPVRPAVGPTVQPLSPVQQLGRPQGVRK
jgi:hypothetical protein